MKLAIVGSVSLGGNAEAAAIIESVLDQYKPAVVVSGGAPGIDTMAEVAAMRRNIEREIYHPERQQWAGPGGFQERNRKIAKACDALIRIVASDSRTYGSGWTRDRAADLGKPTAEYIIQVSR